MPRVTRVRMTIAAAVVVTAGLTGAFAWATIPDGSGVIHGCYQKNSGSLRVVDEGVACQASELAVDWNQQGPQGETGATGPAGLANAIAGSVTLPTLCLPARSAAPFRARRTRAPPTGWRP